MQRPPTHPGTTRRPALNNATALHNDSLSLPRAAALHDCSLPSTSTLSPSLFRRVNVHRRRQCTDWVASEITYCSQFDSDNCLRRRVGAGTLLKVISETVTTRIYMGRTQRNERFRVGLYACVFTRSRGFVCQRFQEEAGRLDSRCGFLKHQLLVHYIYKLQLPFLHALRSRYDSALLVVASLSVISRCSLKTAGRIKHVDRRNVLWVISTTFRKHLRCRSLTERSRFKLSQYLGRNACKSVDAVYCYRLIGVVCVYVCLCSAH